MRFTVSARLIDMMSPQEMAVAVGIDPKGPVQWMLTESFMQHCKPRIPASQGRFLEDSGRNECTRAVWDNPYAHYHYIGLVRTDEKGRTWVGEGEQKPVLTDREMVYDKTQNPEAGPYWPQRTIAADIGEILAETRAVMRKQGR